MAPRIAFQHDVGKYIPSTTTLKKRFTSIHSWELPKQDSALAPPYVWYEIKG